MDSSPSISTGVKRLVNVAAYRRTFVIVFGVRRSETAQSRTVMLRVTTWRTCGSNRGAMASNFALCPTSQTRKLVLKR